MAHATSLAGTVAGQGTCQQWPERMIRFTINASGDTLTIAASIHGADGPPPKPSPPRQAAPLKSDATPPQVENSATASRRADTGEFYGLLAELACNLGEPRRLRDCTGYSGWPTHGVYFFFEDGEVRVDNTARVVRVGTHALTDTSQTTLWDRLRQHRGHLAGQHAGGGNHRASVFRRHVGAALIRSEGMSAELLQSWLDHHSNAELATEEDLVELEVSRRIGTMPFLWLSVSGRADRGYIERNSIALLSGRAGGVDVPSDGWLGHYAEPPEIRESGLWNVQHVDDHYEPQFLRRLAELVRQAGERIA